MATDVGCSAAAMHERRWMVPASPQRSSRWIVASFSTLVGLARGRVKTAKPLLRLVNKGKWVVIVNIRTGEVNGKRQIWRTSSTRS